MQVPCILMGAKMLVKDIMTNEFVSVDVSTATVSDAMAKLKEADVYQIPAVKNGKYVGMLDYREILRRNSIQMKAKAETFLVKTSTVSPDDDISYLISLIVDTGLTAFPVIEKGKLAGIISRTDILKVINDMPGVSEIRNRQIMSSEPVLVSEDEDVDSAAIKMRSLGESEIPVIDRNERLSGILRLDDIAADTFKRQKQSIRGGYMATGDIGGDKIKAEATSKSLMGNPAFVLPGDSISRTAEELLDKRLHVLPVVDDKMKVIGVVGISDIIDSLDTGRKTEGVLIQVTGLNPEDLELYDITFTMASKFLVRFSRITGLTHGKLNIQVIKYRSEGRTKYSVRTKIIAEPLSMSLDHHDWNYGKCLSFIFETYEPRLRKWKTK